MEIINRYQNYETLMKKKFSAYDWSISDPEDYDTLIWNSDPELKPTKEFLDMKLQAARNNYAAQRQQHFPSVIEQLDMLWHSMDSEEIPGKGCAWYNMIKQIKQTFPKP